MKKQFVLLALGMMLVGGVANAGDLANDVNYSAPAKDRDNAMIGGASCPYAKGSQASLNDSTTPVADQVAKMGRLSDDTVTK